MIGRTLQRLRKAAGLSQSELAERLNERGEKFHQQTILKVENGTRPLKFTEAITVCDILQVPVDAFVSQKHAVAAASQGTTLMRRTNNAYEALTAAAGAVQEARVELAEWLADAPDVLLQGMEQPARAILAVDPVALVSETIDNAAVKRAERARVNTDELMN